MKSCRFAFVLQMKIKINGSFHPQGVILGSQFYLYIVIPTIAGRATDIFGGKWVAFAGALGPCILSAITPLAVRAGGGAGVLIAIRTLMGAFHGCVYPAMFSLYTKWFPVRERANANAGLSFGGGLGSTVMYLLGGWLCGTEVGWPAVFYANTVLYIPWMVLWLWCCTNDPSENRLLSEKEVQYIETHIPKATTAVSTNASQMIILLMFQYPLIRKRSKPSGSRYSPQFRCYAR